MALDVVSDKDLIYNKKLAFVTFTSCNPTLHPPDIDTGIANSGLSHFYFAPGAPVANYDATAYTMGVRVAIGTPLHSIASGELALVTALPPASRKGHVMAGFPHSLIGLAPFVVVGCYSLPTQQSLHSIEMARSSLKVGTSPPAPNFGAGRSSHKYHCHLTCPKHSSSWGLVRMAPKWRPSKQYTPSSHPCTLALSCNCCSQ